MTTDHDLRTLLADEAAGPTRSAAGWDQVVSRGRRHRRVTRARQGLLLSAAAVALVGVVNLTAGEGQRTETIEPVDSATTVPEGPATTLQPPISGEATRDIVGGRQAGGTLVLQVQALADPADADPCQTDALLLSGGGDGVVARMVPAGTEGARRFDECRVGFFSGWVRVVLGEPLHNRLIDGFDGAPVELADSDSLLLPTSLPAGFPQVTDRDEFGPEPVNGAYSFSWSHGDVVLRVTASDAPALGDCDGQPQVVRGFAGTRCESDGAIVLQWEEGGKHRRVELADVGGNPLTLSLQDVLAVADGLAPASEAEAG